MDREMFEHGLRTGHIRDAQPKEAVQTAASYRSGAEAIVIQHALFLTSAQSIRSSLSLLSAQRTG